MRAETFAQRVPGPSPPSRAAVIAALAAQQHGIVTLAQLLAAGLDHAAIWRRARDGTLHRVHRGVYAVGHQALSREGQWVAAMFAAAGALFKLSATELWQLGRHRSPLIAVVTTSWRRPHGVAVQRANRLDPRDITRHRGIAVTTVARTLVDLTDVLIAEDLANVIYEAAYRKRFSLSATRAAMARANGRHHLDVLQDAIALHLSGSAGLRSRLEATFLSLLQAADLAKPLINTRLHGVEVDFHWPALKLVVEIDGPGHRRPQAKRDDARRSRSLGAAGYTVLRFTEEDLELRPELVVARLRSGAPTPRPA